MTESAFEIKSEPKPVKSFRASSESQAKLKDASEKTGLTESDLINRCILIGAPQILAAQKKGQKK
jgi:hypothetical protein